MNSKVSHYDLSSIIRDTVCMSVGVYKVGRKRQIQGYKYIEGEETIGIDLEADKGKTLVTFQPMY